MSADRESWPTLDELLREEGELELAGLSETDAYELGMLAVTAATEQRLPVSVGRVAGRAAAVPLWPAGVDGGQRRVAAPQGAGGDAVRALLARTWPGCARTSR